MSEAAKDVAESARDGLFGTEALLKLIDSDVIKP